MVAALRRKKPLKPCPLPIPHTQKPAITPALCDALFGFLQSGVMLTVQITRGQVTLELWRDLIDDLYHTRYTFDLSDMYPDDLPDVVEPPPSPILLDTLEEIAERSPQLFQRLHASFALDVHVGVC